MFLNNQKAKTEVFWWRLFHLSVAIALVIGFIALMLAAAEAPVWKGLLAFFLMISSGICADHAQRKARRIQANM